jgi:hypothetical protein
MSFDPNKPCQTRQGRSARVVATDLAGNKPLCVILRSDRGDEYPANYRADGTFAGYSAHPYDLVNIPEKIEGWVNVYRQNASADFFPSKEDADAALPWRDRPRIACIKVSFSEGDGL